MQAEMPKKYWRNLPEASLIPGMIEGAEEAAGEMIAKMATQPAPHHAKVQAKHWPKQPAVEPGDGADAASIDELRELAKGCRRCPLWRDATQTVFGEGPDNAKVVFVGEQPGDQEDIAGKPFVGPAGKVFDAILEDAGVERDKVYVTNAVKHFKFEPRGKRRIHSKPNAGEIQACRWWIDRELDLIKPDLVVALGATAAQSLLGKAVPVTKFRGEVIEREDGLRVFITIHPSFILRIREAADKEAERARFLKDMVAVKKLMAALSLFASHLTRIALRSFTFVPVGPGTNRSPTALNAVQALLPASIALASTPAARMRKTVEPSAKAPALSSEPSMPSVSAASAEMPSMPSMPMAKASRNSLLRPPLPLARSVTVVSPPDRISTGFWNGRFRVATSRAIAA